MSIILDNFEGPIELLFQLIQQSEIDIYEVKLQQITNQFIAHLKHNPHSVDTGAEFIAIASTLVWWKSKSLLPSQDETPVEDICEEEDPHFNVIHHLIDYCRFKEAAKELSNREQNQQGLYARGMISSPEIKRPLGIEHLTLDDLAGLFKEIAAKSISKKGIVEEETWKLADKISEIRQNLKPIDRLDFNEIFSYEKSRLELIVSFLAILELMKLGEISIIKELSTGKLFLWNNLAGQSFK